MTTLRVAAIDLGATSGRVMVGTVGPDRLELEEVHRFPNGPVHLEPGGPLVWDIARINRETLNGIRLAQQGGPLDGIGIDSWAVDYGLIGTDGSLLGSVVSYRDPRTDGVMDRVLETVSRRRLYDVTGLQQLPFNTIYQLVSAAGAPELEQAETLLLIPDLLGYWLTGQVGAEVTNASTTQLLDVRSRTWSTELAEQVGVPARILPQLREPGDLVGTVLPELAAEVGLPSDIPVIAVGSHDTASAVVAVPANEGANFAYISSGTWSLVGVELDEPVLTEEAMEANFTNEGGVDGTTRLLRNVMGLWVLSETMKAWEEKGQGRSLPNLLVEAAGVETFRSLIDIDSPAFLAPGDMTQRIEHACLASGQPVPRSKPELTRCILESLALAYRRAVRCAADLSGQHVEVVHLVGGGTRNRLLCQLTADACGVPVLAGPAEAAALGNVLVQARALGANLPDLASMRALVRTTQELRHYEPSGSLDWDSAEVQLAIGVT